MKCCSTELKFAVGVAHYLSSENAGYNLVRTFVAENMQFKFSVAVLFLVP